MGGSGTEFPVKIAIDNEGNSYLAGTTTSPDFPTTAGAFQKNLKGDTDIFISKLDTTTSTLIYSTYIGGNDRDDGRDIAVDVIGSAYVTGFTISSNFPTINSFQEDQGFDDAFVIKLDPSGSSLVYSTYLGGSSGDAGLAIAVDSESNAYVTGFTNSLDFPVVNPIQTPSVLTSDVFITKLSPTGSNLEYSTYLVGSGREEGFDIFVDANSIVYVVGVTGSPDFPVVNPIQSNLGGSSDAFLTKIDSSGSSFIFSTYLGGVNKENGFGIVADSQGNAYITGDTESLNFPVVNAFQSQCNSRPFQETVVCADAFVTKLDTNTSAIVYSTYLGGDGDGRTGHEEVGLSIALDDFGRAYVTGSTRSIDFPVINAIQSTFGGGTGDTFVTKFDAQGTALVFSTFLGGGDEEVGLSVKVNRGNIYVGGATRSSNFPLVNPIQSGFGGGTFDAFLVRIFEGEPLPIPPEHRPEPPVPSGIPTTPGPPETRPTPRGGRP